jgi:hypothetical protein
VAPDRLRWHVPDRRPGETAFVLVRGNAGEDWTYLGVGHWREDESAWATPELDFPLWRALGTGRGASRRLPAESLTRAAELVEDVLAKVRTGRSPVLAGTHYRIVGKAKEGGLRLEGGEASKTSARTVSLTDLAWVLHAREAAPPRVRVDEAFINKQRYLSGTPKGSTRFIDTPLAMALVDWCRTG